jgi:hypothetical protein
VGGLGWVWVGHRQNPLNSARSSDVRATSHANGLDFPTSLVRGYIGGRQFLVTVTSSRSLLLGLSLALIRFLVRVLQRLRGVVRVRYAEVERFASACHRQKNVTRVASCLPWTKPARAEGMRVDGSIWFVPIAVWESASGVITSTRLPCLRRTST